MIFEIAPVTYLVKVGIKISKKMIYKAIGVMSGSSLDGLDIGFTAFTETGGKWGYEIIAATCFAYNDQWIKRLENATHLTAKEYLQLDIDYGHYTGKMINAFIDTHNLHHQVNLIASHGHTAFHSPATKMTAQLGDGAAIAAVTKLPVVSNLRSLDVAFGGQGAPVVPIGEKLLFNGFTYFLNLGGIANISFNQDGQFKAFDVCAANRVLNMLAAKRNLLYDEGGKLARSGKADSTMLDTLNALSFYKLPAPKSLANDFGTATIYPLLEAGQLSVEDALCTYTEHIVGQIKMAIEQNEVSIPNKKMLITGGGAFNTFLVERLSSAIEEFAVEIVVPADDLVKYKEAIIMGLIGVLRWREEINVLATVTGATQSSIGGALWLGTQG